MRRVVDPPIGTKKLQINPFGIIPKPHEPGKWRLILNLSSPRGASVNDGIDPDLCSISYVRIDQAAKRALDMGHGALMAKLDLQNAYRIVPVHEDDRHLLGMKWKGAVCLDAALPFGLRSAPKNFQPLPTRCFGSCTIEVSRLVFTIWTISWSWDLRDRMNVQIT